MPGGTDEPGDGAAADGAPAVPHGRMDVEEPSSAEDSAGGGERWTGRRSVTTTPGRTSVCSSCGARRGCSCAAAEPSQRGGARRARPEPTVTRRTCMRAPRAAWRRAVARALTRRPATAPHAAADDTPRDRLLALLEDVISARPIEASLAREARAVPCHVSLVRRRARLWLTPIMRSPWRVQVRDAVVNNTLFVPHSLSVALHTATAQAGALPRAADDAPPGDGSSGAEDESRGRAPQADGRCDRPRGHQCTRAALTAPPRGAPPPPTSHLTPAARPPLPGARRRPCG